MHLVGIMSLIIANQMPHAPVSVPAPVPQPQISHAQDPVPMQTPAPEATAPTETPVEGGENSVEIWSNTRANRRTKERKISFVIEKVSMWRKLYNGIQDNSGKIVRYSLEDAAKKVGISKKSLDDYLLQLRYGKKYGFDFNEHKEAKIGVLRAFVKKKKTDEKDASKRAKDGSE